MLGSGTQQKLGNLLNNAYLLWEIMELFRARRGPGGQFMCCGELSQGSQQLSGEALTCPEVGGLDEKKYRVSSNKKY